MEKPRLSDCGSAPSELMPEARFELGLLLIPSAVSSMLCCYTSKRTVTKSVPRNILTNWCRRTDSAILSMFSEKSDFSVFNRASSQERLGAF